MGVDARVMNIKILHVISGLGTGGAEVMLARLCGALADRGVENRVVCLGIGGPVADLLVEQGVCVDCLGLKPGRFTPRGWLRLRSIAKHYQPDVIHGWMYHGALASQSVVFSKKTPSLVMGVHYTPMDLKSEKLKTRVVMRALAKLSRRFGAITYVSAASKAVHESMGYYPRAAEIIPNGFDLERFIDDPKAKSRIRNELLISPEQFVVGHVARYHPMKDHANLLRAAAEFIKRVPDAVFILIGDGVTTENQALVTLANRLGIYSHLRLCGRRNDIPALNAAMDVATSSSYCEAFPLSLGEAMACSVPCVATDIGDIREIIGDAGIVVPPRNPQALCDGWQQLANMDGDTRKSLGLLGRERIAKRYSLSACTDSHIELYKRLVGN